MAWHGKDKVEQEKIDVNYLFISYQILINLCT